MLERSPLSGHNGANLNICSRPVELFSSVPLPLCTSYNSNNPDHGTWQPNDESQPIIQMDFCEFLSEDELIEIVPNFRYNEVLCLINGDFGPFVPAMPIQVPIWMALNLYRQQKCRINLPVWLHELNTLCEEQKNSPTLIKMPCDHWREIIKLLASHNIPLPHKQIESLIDRRDAIMSKSIHALLNQVVDLDEDQISQVKIKNITKFELATLKKVILPNLAESKSIQKL